MQEYENLWLPFYKSNFAKAINKNAQMGLNKILNC